MREKKVEIDNPTSSGESENYTKYVSFTWPPLEAPLSICNVTFSLKYIFEKLLIKRKGIPYNTES